MEDRGIDIYFYATTQDIQLMFTVAVCHERHHSQYAVLIGWQGTARQLEPAR